MLLRAYIRLLRWSFARFYREFAWTYDTVAAAVSRGLWRRWIEAVVPRLHGERAVIAHQGHEQHVPLDLPGERMDRDERIGAFEIRPRREHDDIRGSRHTARRQEAESQRAEAD